MSTVLQQPQKSAACPIICSNANLSRCRNNRIPLDFEAAPGIFPRIVLVPYSIHMSHKEHRMLSFSGNINIAIQRTDSTRKNRSGQCCKFLQYRQSVIQRETQEFQKDLIGLFFSNSIKLQSFTTAFLRIEGIDTMYQRAKGGSKERINSFSSAPL